MPAVGLFGGLDVTGRAYGNADMAEHRTARVEPGERAGERQCTNRCDARGGGAGQTAMSSTVLYSTLGKYPLHSDAYYDT